MSKTAKFGQKSQGILGVKLDFDKKNPLQDSTPHNTIVQQTHMILTSLIQKLIVEYSIELPCLVQFGH
jgi:hypothetical protein